MASLAPLTVAGILTGFIHKPEEFQLSLRPSRTEILTFRRMLLKNLSTHCTIGNSRGTWRFLLLSVTEYRREQCILLDIDPDDEIAVNEGEDEGLIVPVPGIVPPAPFVPGDAVNETQMAYRILRDTFNYNVTNYSNCESYKEALLNVMKQAMPDSLWTRYIDVNGIVFRTPLHILKDLTEQYGAITPRERDALIATLNSPYSDCDDMNIYFRRQNDCIAGLRHSYVAVNPASAICSSLLHMQRLPEMRRACVHWDDIAADLIDAPTEGDWNTFQKHFIDAMRLYRDQESNLNDSGLHHAANLANERFSDLTNLVISQGHALATLQNERERDFHHTPSIAPSVAPPIDHIQHCDRTMANSTIAHDTALLADLVAEVRSLRAEVRADVQSTSSSRPGNRHVSDRSTAARPSTNLTDRKRKYTTNRNYCWTHGFDICDSHTGKTCMHPADGHKKDATLRNRMGGSAKNLDLSN